MSELTPRVHDAQVRAKAEEQRQMQTQSMDGETYGFYQRMFSHWDGEPMALVGFIQLIRSRTRDKAASLCTNHAAAKSAECAEALQKERPGYSRGIGVAATAEAAAATTLAEAIKAMKV